MKEALSMALVLPSDFNVVKFARCISRPVYSVYLCLDHSRRSVRPMFAGFLENIVLADEFDQGFECVIFLVHSGGQVVYF